jgi:glycerol transport system ATP-binding protein
VASITVDNVRHAYEGAESAALRQVSLSFRDGGAYALLGPSGCGKTTLINIISGLLTPSEGRVLFDDADVTAQTPEQRNIAQVFQFPVVYDAMTVRENLEFPLRNRGVRGRELNARVDAVLNMTGLVDVASRRARGLSPELKQKVSLGRGLVREDVAAILFDEPLTVIDPRVKWDLRVQLKALHRRSGRTMIYVTHDQTEALTFADQVVVLHAGEVVQVGPPKALFDRPEHTFVGYFIGAPGMNVVPVKVDHDRALLGGQVVQLSGPPAYDATGQLELGVRPEHVRLDPVGLPCVLDRVEDLGRRRIGHARIEGCSITFVLQPNEPVPADVRLRFDPARTHLYAGGRRVPLAGEAT